MRKQTFTAISLCLAGLATAPALPAQTLEMTNPPATAPAVATPGRGQTMAQVERQFGAPTERFAAVGQPPITRWVYADKIVYFEYDHVVHAVTLRR
ncbi:MAG: hypothetical protein OEY13_07095 [Gammaproteobacteria bacterium]|nr:hypothetical protein [Gammaproteobacteria bacterium]MDH4310443.1 hypothetical protein [Gammaproteobacteria bacterium]MDH5272825.1 hypothetical protein [Gammaproteobacteria bacterium]